MTIPVAKYWYAIKSLPKKDKRTAAYLKKIGLEYYLPIVRQLRQWSDRKKWVDTTIMSPYLFVRTEEKNRNRIFDSGSVHSYVYRQGKAAVISEAELTTIKHLCDYGHEFKFNETAIVTGDWVEIISGALMGKRGRALESEGKYRLHIELSDMGFWASVHVDLKHLRKLD
ncbi:MAG: UpxY family transcription antiterminator [Saprospiraceae bacterium]